MQGTDFAGQALIFLRLPGLALEAVKGRFKLVGDVIEPRQVGFGSPQAQFGLVAAGVEARNTSGLFQDPAPVLRLGSNQF